MESIELVVKIIAWVDVVISSLSFAIVGIFAVILACVPEYFDKIVAEDLDDATGDTNHPVIDKLMQLDAGQLALLIVGLLLFWGTYIALSVLLLRWTKRNYVSGLRIWFIFRATLTLLFFPIDLYWMFPEADTTDIVVFVMFNFYYLFSLWAVWVLMRHISSIQGESRQIVEFQAL